MMTEVDVLRSNGLLGEPSFPHAEESRMDASDTFQHNGLLVYPDEQRELHVDNEDTGTGPSTQNGRDQEGLLANGLLGESFQCPASASEAGFGSLQPSLLSDSQDDSLPSLSEILRPYARNDAANDHARTSRTSWFGVRATTYDGQSLNIKRKRRGPTQREGAMSSSSRMSKLLDVPIHRLMEELSRKEAESLALIDSLPGRTGIEPASSSAMPTRDLWTDRYKPTRFTDLIGDERVHRETLAWVKQWDFCVFGPQKVIGKNKGKKRARDEWSPNAGSSNQDQDWEESKDEWKRPKEKLLLLSGPPGLGKTTLAHVVAQQAGYSVFEINASDARSGSIIDDRIKPALEAGAAVGKSKPYLVVIDEIDGATGAGDNAGSFVQKLIQLTFDNPKKKGRNNKPERVRPLLRPIICICNDLYASSLTKLRQHARIIRFNRPSDVHIVKRLRWICEEEELKAEARALSALVGIAKGDFRGCLNTLQFIKARNQEVSESVVRAATAGMKETDSSYMSVLGDLFAPMTRKRVKELAITETEEAAYVGRLSRSIEACGAIDRIALGCFEHYLNLRRHDATFDRYEKAEEWLVTYDMLNGAMRTEREYALIPYLPYSMVAFYPLFHERGGPKVERPKVDWENFLVTRTNEEIYKSLSKGLRMAGASRNGDYRHLASDEVLQLEFAPLINRIISPPLRPVNSQVIKPQEKALLSRLVDVMVSLELRFVQEKDDDGRLVYRLDPPVDVFVTYEGKRAADLSVSRYAVRHLVAQEIDAKLIARHAEAIERTKAGRFDYFGSRASHANHDGAEDERPEGADDDGEATLVQAPDPAGPALKRSKTEQQKLDIADKPPVDFFGRPIKIAPTTSSKRAVAIKKYKVSYRFKEGNSAAVRRPVKVASFL